MIDYFERQQIWIGKFDFLLQFDFAQWVYDGEYLLKIFK